MTITQSQRLIRLAAAPAAAAGILAGSLGLAGVANASTNASPGPYSYTVQDANGYYARQLAAFRTQVQTVQQNLAKLYQAYYPSPPATPSWQY